MRVLIVGAGTVGLCTALFLARQGVRSQVVERRHGLSTHPRAFGLSNRSAEVLREAGITPTTDRVIGVASGTSLADLSTSTGDLSPLAEMADKLGPTKGGNCPQDRIDPLVMAAATELGVEVSFGTEVIGLDSTTATVRRDDETSTIEADYVIAADGAGSRVRGLLDIGSTGPGVLGGHMLNVLFRADLPTPTYSMCVLNNPESSGILIPVDDKGRWIFHIPMGPLDASAERYRELIQIATGLPDLDIEIISTLPWSSTARTADKFRAGNVFLVGDAAHVVPPIGGFGLNTGIADAHNLAWKLAMVSTGEAGPGLLDSYEAERRPVALFTMRQTLIRGEHRDLHWDFSPERAAERARVGMVNILIPSIGYRYDSRAVIDPVPELPSLEEVVLDGTPGSRVPQLLTEDGVSTVDLVDGKFLLLAGSKADGWLTAAKELDIRAFSVQGLDAALLVRPDGFVGWRARGGEPNAAVLRHALDRILAQETLDSAA